MSFDLFNYQPPPSYPLIAGAKESTTSLDAANAIEATGRAARLRGLVLSWFESGNTGTADECAHAIGEDILSIRPRVCELSKQQPPLLIKTGLRRAMDGGRPGHVWGAVSKVRVAA